MPDRPERDAGRLIPARPTLPRVRDAAADCEACDLYRQATQTVFGEGARKAELMLVGEQPGDAEDLSGHPFVGPAGKLLDRALVEAGIDRAAVYVTNAVKHFKWEPRGKRRIHKKPNAGEIVSSPLAEVVMATVHPSSLLRAPDDETRHRETRRFIEDLRQVRRALKL
jgi:DNA polymerase